MMAEVELSAGTIEYEDTDGDGPVVVLLHGVTMDGSVWRKVVADLRSDHRCVVPTLPLGAHRRPMRPDADLSLRGQAGIVAEFVERLDLREVTLVCNDWGGGLLLGSDGRDERIGRLVLAACETFDNYPPGLAGKNLALLGRLPGGLALAAQALRLAPLRRLPVSYGWLSKRPVPREIMDRWLRPLLTQPEVRRDLRKYVSDVKQARKELLAATEKLAHFGRPVLVAWALEDRLMPVDHGRRLAELIPRARLVEISDSYTLIPEDQPRELATGIREFIAQEAVEAAA
jgi:pimeloyl-ACP methyl ester carboxylesterase